MRAKSAASSPNDKHLLYVVQNGINDVLGHLSASAYLLNRMNSVSDNLCTLIVQVNITNRSFQKSYLSYSKIWSHTFEERLLYLQNNQTKIYANYNRLA